jgi:molecular chaperone Hsp33
MADQIQRFIFDRADVRGEIAQLDAAYRQIIGRSEQSPAVQQLMGEGLVAAALLAATLKYPSALTLQLQSTGPLSLLLIQVGSDGTMRAMARTRGEVPANAPLGEQASQGTLAITIEPEDGGERYQGIVDLSGGSLAAALEHYFAESEQLPTHVWLSADPERAAGLLLQRLPGPDGGPARDEDAWERAGQLAATVTGAELRELSADAVLHRLFHEEDIRLFEPSPLRFGCRCSRQRVADMLRSLGADELRETLAEQGQIQVHCDFCNEPYRFDAVDVEALCVDPTTRAAPSDTSH